MITAAKIRAVKHCSGMPRSEYLYSERAEYVLNKIQQLHAIEQQCTEQRFTDSQRANARLQQSKPILKELGGWMRL